MWYDGDDTCIGGLKEVEFKLPILGHHVGA